MANAAIEILDQILAYKDDRVFSILTLIAQEEDPKFSELIAHDARVHKFMASVTQPSEQFFDLVTNLMVADSKMSKVE